MSVLPDWKIRDLAITKGMIDPFAEGEHRPGMISYGLTSCGYDMRIAEDFKLFLPTADGSFVDVKAFNPDFLRTAYTGSRCIIPPNSYALGHSVERFQMPPDILGVCVGKSTYARAGIIVNVTPLEPGWSGYLTIEISNSASCPVIVYANEGIAQILFFRSEGMPEKNYASKQGKYQDQPAKIVLPRVI